MKRKGITSEQRITDFSAGALVGGLIGVAFGVAGGSLISAHVANLFGDEGAKATIYMGIPGIAGVVASIVANGYLARRATEEQERIKREDAQRTHSDQVAILQLSLAEEVGQLVSYAENLSKMMLSDDRTPANCGYIVREFLSIKPTVFQSVVDKIMMLGHDIAPSVFYLYRKFATLQTLLGHMVDDDVKFTQLHRKKIATMARHFSERGLMHQILLSGHITVAEWCAELASMGRRHGEEYAPLRSV